MTNLIDELFRKVDQLGTTFVERTFVALANELHVMFSLLFTLYLVFWGYQVWSGRASGSFSDHAFRLFRVFVIHTLAIYWGDFQTFAYKAATEAPTAIGNMVIRAVGSRGLTPGNASIEQSLSNVYHLGTETVQAITRNAGLTNPGPYIPAAVIWIVVALFVGYAAFLVIFAKIALWLLLSLAPLFIIMLLFNATRRYFEGWLTGLVQFLVLPILVYTMLAFYLTVIDEAVKTLSRSNGNVATTLTEAAPVLLAGIIGILLLSQLIPVAAMIAGGGAYVGTPGLWAFMRPAFATGLAGIIGSGAGAAALVRRGYRAFSARRATDVSDTRSGIAGTPLDEAGRAMQTKLTR